LDENRATEIFTHLYMHVGRNKYCEHLEDVLKDRRFVSDHELKDAVQTKWQPGQKHFSANGIHNALLNAHNYWGG
jgi:hypothetical protein